MRRKAAAWSGRNAPDGDGRYELFVLGKDCPVKTTIVRLAFLCGIAATADGALAQYYSPPVSRLTAAYRAPGAAPAYVPKMAQLLPTAPVTAYTAPPVQAPPVAQPYVAAPVPAFQPINPPKGRQLQKPQPQQAQRPPVQKQPVQQAQRPPMQRPQPPRALMASRTPNTPTPAPAQMRPAARTQIAPPAAGQAPAMWNPSSTGMGWTPQSQQGMPTDYGTGISGYGTNGMYGNGAGTYGTNGTYANGAATNAAPVADPQMDYTYGGDGTPGDCCDSGSCGRGRLHLGCCCCGLGCMHGCCEGLHNCLANFCCVPFCTTGDMAQHTPFFGTTHGYYYFRPYHVMHVFSQQELATRWGGDPRNPYDNTMFQRIYEQMGVQSKVPLKGAAGMTPPNGTEYIGPGQTIMAPTPTPTPGYDQLPPQTYGYPPAGTMPQRSNMMPTPGAMPAPGSMTMPPSLPSNIAPLPGIENIAPPTR